MKDIIIDLQKYGEWKVQPSIEIDLISSKDADEERVRHSKRSNTEFNTFDNINNIVDAIFKTLFSRYYYVLETSFRGSDFTFDSV